MAKRVTEVDRLVRMGKAMEKTPSRTLEYAESLLRVRDREGVLRPLVANAAQRAYEVRRGRENIVLKARQLGMTTWVAARFFLATILKPGTLTLQVAHTRAAAESIFGAVDRMWENLPADMREGTLKRSRSNVGQMVFDAIDSEFRVASACEVSPGRGLTLQNLHCSEVSRWPGDAAATLAGLRAALAPGGELVLESTPNGAYGAFYAQWQQASEAGEDGMVRHFLPWWLEPAYVGAPVSVCDMSEPERTLVGLHGLTGEQIGFRRGLERSYGVLRSQEFAEDAESCFRASGECCFDVEAIERRSAQTPEPLETRRGGALQIWLQPMPGLEYLVGVDSAGGGSDGDFAGVQVVDLQTGLQCAELRQRLRPAEAAAAAASLAREYGGASIAVERNNHGAAVLAYLETAERYPRLWRGADEREAGWLTTAASKPEMVARIGTMLEQTPQIFNSKRLLTECRTFVAGERGRSGAAAGAHDDLVMAMAVAQAARASTLETGMGKGRAVAYAQGTASTLQSGTGTAEWR